MKRGDNVWFFNMRHELKEAHILRKEGTLYIIKDKTGTLHRRKLCQLAIKEEKCKV